MSGPQLDIGEGEFHPAVDRFGPESDEFEPREPFAAGRRAIEADRRLGLGDVPVGERHLAFGQFDPSVGLAEVKLRRGDFVGNGVADLVAKRPALLTPAREIGGFRRVMHCGQQRSAGGGRDREAETGLKHSQQRPGGGQRRLVHAAAEGLNRPQVAATFQGSLQRVVELLDRQLAGKWVRQVCRLRVADGPTRLPRELATQFSGGELGAGLLVSNRQLAAAEFAAVTVGQLQRFGSLGHVDQSFEVVFGVSQKRLLSFQAGDSTIGTQRPGGRFVAVVIRQVSQYRVQKADPLAARLVAAVQRRGQRSPLEFE